MRGTLIREDDDGTKHFTVLDEPATEAKKMMTKQVLQSSSYNGTNALSGMCSFIVGLGLPIAIALIISQHSTDQCDALLFEFLCGSMLIYFVLSAFSCVKLIKTTIAFDPDFFRSKLAHVTALCELVATIFLLGWTIAGAVWHTDSTNPPNSIGVMEANEHCDDDIVRLSLAIVIINFVTIPIFMCSVAVAVCVCLKVLSAGDDDCDDEDCDDGDY